MYEYRDLQKATNMPRPNLKSILLLVDNIRPGTIGKVAKALQVDVTEILAEEKEDC